MHEMSIVANLLDILKEEATKAGARRITGIRLRVGKLSGFEPDHLRFAFELASKGTIAEGASISLEEVDAEVKCKRCAEVSEADDLIVSCPVCGSPDVERTSGNELLLERIEVEV